MKYRVIYDTKSVLDIVESTNSTTIYPSGIMALEGELKNCKLALLAMGVNVDRIDEALGFQKATISNYMELPISNHPTLTGITRTAQIAGEHDYTELNEFHLQVRVKHFRDGVHVPDEVADKIVNLIADNNTQIVIDSLGNTMGEYDYLLMAYQNGVDREALKQQTVLEKDTVEHGKRYDNY
jgi:hypothetical protein